MPRPKGKPQYQPIRKDLRQQKAEIDKLGHLEMAKLVRFAPLGHDYFTYGPLYDYFMARFQSLGGMTPSVSKAIGWKE